MKQLVIVIPVYNEIKNLDNLFDEWSHILPKSQFDFLFVNDGSSDESKFLIEKYQSIYSNIILLNKENSGHGHTILKGYEYAIEKKYNFVFQIDSDNQFSNLDFNKFWSEKDSNFDLIIGNRKKRNDPYLRVFLSKVILRNLIKLIFFKNIKDPNIPYRLIKIKALKDYIDSLTFIPLAPNLLMSIYIDNIKIVDVTHFKRKYGDITWPLTKLINFSIKLIIELILYRKKILKNNEK